VKKQRIRCRSVSKGIAQGRVLVSRQRISFLGGVDPVTGIFVDRALDVYGREVSNRILVFPGGKGSTVGSYVIYQLKLHAKSPIAMILTHRADTIVAVGAIIAEIPAVDSPECECELTELIKDDEEVVVNGTEGYIEIGV